MSTMMSPVRRLAELFDSEGAGDYLGEPVTVAQHLLQAAALTEPVRLHVTAKRYLCAAEPGCFGKLSQASVYTLSVQGGPMTEAEARGFESVPFAAGAIAVRRWDDQAKDPDVTVPAFEHYRPLLEGLLAPPIG